MIDEYFYKECYYTMEEIIIRYATEADYEAFNKLYCQCVLLGGTDTPSNTKPYGRESFKMDCETNIIVAVKNGELVGYTLLDATDEPDVIHISEMFTTISVRRTGVGRKMLEFLESEMKWSQFTKLDLMSAFRETDCVWERMGFNSVNFTDQYRKVVN